MSMLLDRIGRRITDVTNVLAFITHHKSHGLRAGGGRLILTGGHFRSSSQSVVCCVVAILSSVFFASHSPLLAQQPNSAAAQVVAGWKAYQEGRPNDAKPLLEEAVRLAPAIADYQAALAEIDSKLGEQDAAIQHLKRAILLKPFNTEFRLDLAQILQQTGNDREALRILQIMHPDPQLADVWHFSRGFSLFRLGSFVRAANEFKLVVQKPKFKASASFFLGNIAYAQNRFDEAEAYLATAVELGNGEGNKAYNAYTYDYGLVLFRLEKFAEADRQFRTSIAQYDKDPLPWMFLGRCEEELGNYSEAIVMLETSSKVDSTFQLSDYELARLEQRHGDPNRAAELFQKISVENQEDISQEQERAMKLETAPRPESSSNSIQGQSQR